MVLLLLISLPYQQISSFPANIHLSKVNNGNTRMSWDELPTMEYRNFASFFDMRKS